MKIQSMYAELVELCWNGRKHPRSARPGLPRYRGEVTVGQYFVTYGLDRSPAWASLKPYGQVEDLHEVKIAYWRGRNMVLFGDQRVDGRIHNQMWWVRILGPS